LVPRPSGSPLVKRQPVLSEERSAGENGWACTVMAAMIPAAAIKVFIKGFIYVTLLYRPMPLNVHLNYAAQNPLPLEAEPGFMPRSLACD